MIARKFEKFPPVFVAILVQAIVWLVLKTALPLVQQQFGVSLPFFWIMVLQGALAASLTYVAGLSYWWVIIQAVAPPLLVLALILQIPVWIFPILLVLLLLTFWNVAINRVPLYLTNDLTAEKIETLLPGQEGLVFVDLGSGLGGTLRHIAAKRPDQQFIGIESAPVPFLLSWFLGKLFGTGNLRFLYGSFWKIDLSSFDVIYCFLSPVPMPDLFDKAKSEMKAGSLFISNSFKVPGHKPNRTVTVKDSRKTKLMIWKI
ncbi:MAG: class I SAM-dependent methyltransferase [Sneathiellales bacterium]|nr:class I SAM-dependent methyltransferase [Sneathiellales bacterium]